MKTWKWILGGLVLLLVAACVIGPLPLEFVVLMLAGWSFYLARTLPNVAVNWGDVVLGMAALGGFALAVHSFCSWLAKERTTKLAASGRSPDQPWRWRWTAALVGLVVLMFVAGTAMIGLVHQTTWLLTMKERKFDYGMQAAERNGSLNNARSIAIAVQNHESATRRYPAGCTTDEQGRLLHGWLTQILPFIEEEQLYKQIDRDAPWDSPANEEHFRVTVHSFQSPVADDYDDDRGFPVAHYAANVHVIGGDQRREMDDIRDGISKTLLAGEAVTRSKAWGSPTNWRDPALGLRASPDGFGGPWNGNVTIMVFADGHSRAISSDIDPRVLQAISTPAGGEEVDLDELE